MAELNVLLGAKMSCQEIFLSSRTPQGKRCSISKASDFSRKHTPLPQEKTAIAQAAKQRAMKILRDALRKKDRVLMEEPKHLVFGDIGDPKYWMERHAILTEEFVRGLISELEAVKFEEDLTRKNSYAYVYPATGDKTVYLCPLFWGAPKHLGEESQPGILIHEVSHFLGIGDNTYSNTSISVACRGKLVKSKSDPSAPDLNPLEEAILNTNNTEHEFAITLNHKGRYEAGQYSCCGEKAVNSVCERAVPEEFLSCDVKKSFSVSKDIDDILMELLLPSTEQVNRYLDELRKIADAIDKVHKGATIANITGGAVGIAEGITTIVGLALTPVTFGASLITSLKGLVVSTRRGLTSAAATTTDIVSSKLKKETVEKLLQECQTELENIQDYVGRIDEKIQSLNNENHDFVFPFAQIGSGAGRSVLNTIKMVRAGQLLANVGRIIKFAGAATHILTILILGLDVFFVAKDSMDLHKGAKTELAAKIREVVKEMEQMIAPINEMVTILNTVNQE